VGQKLGGKGHIGTNLMTQALLEYQTSGVESLEKKGSSSHQCEKGAHGYQPHDTNSITSIRLCTWCQVSDFVLDNFLSSSPLQSF
jgi:hypothetical protein